MAWGEDDDKEVEDCIKKITDKIIKKEDELIPLKRLVHNCQQIKTRKEYKIIDNKKKLVKDKPLDEFGDEMDNKIRMDKKKKCILIAKKILESR